MSPTQPTRIRKGKESEGVWFGYEPDIAPFKALPASDPALLIAREHLAKAIDLYRESIQLDPANFTAKLGYAWALDQSGNRDQAITCSSDLSSYVPSFHLRMLRFCAALER